MVYHLLEGAWRSSLVLSSRFQLKREIFCQEVELSSCFEKKSTLKKRTLKLETRFSIAFSILFFPNLGMTIDA